MSRARLVSLTMARLPRGWGRGGGGLGSNVFEACVRVGVGTLHSMTRGASLGFRFRERQGFGVFWVSV